MVTNLGLALFLQNDTRRESLSSPNSIKCILVFDNSFVVQETSYFPRNPAYYEWQMMDFSIKQGIIVHLNHRGVQLSGVKSTDYNEMIGFYGWTLQIKRPREVYDFIYKNTPHGVFFDLAILNKTLYYFIQTNDFEQFKRNYIKELG